MDVTTGFLRLIGKFMAWSSLILRKQSYMLYMDVLPHLSLYVLVIHQEVASALHARGIPSTGIWQPLFRGSHET